MQLQLPAPKKRVRLHVTKGEFYHFDPSVNRIPGKAPQEDLQTQFRLPVLTPLPWTHG